MPAFDDPEIIRKRKALFAKFAKNDLAQQRRLANNDLQVIDEVQKSPNESSKIGKEPKPWMNKQEEEAHRNEQFAYVAKHRKAFESEIAECPDDQDENKPEATQGDDASCSRDDNSTDVYANCSSLIKSQRLANPTKFYPVDYDSSHETTSSVSSGKETVQSSSTVRGAGQRSIRGRGGAFMAKSGSVCVYDQTSTVLAPTSVQNRANNQFDNDYESNVNIGELQKNYFKNYKTNTTLPIYQSRQYIINCINSYNVVIVEGLTGCGKTTQVPMYILEDAVTGQNPNRPSPVIYVTQPRKIAARSIARRVCDEHNWELGSIVGYQVGLDRVASGHTVLTFCTSGVLLQKLINEKSLSNYSHIIIDEAHERDADTDLLMMLIRTLMRKEKSFFRLVVMSATMDIDRLKSYYTCNLPYGYFGLAKPSICRVGGGVKQNETQILYNDNLSPFMSVERFPEFSLEEPMIYDECYMTAVKLILEVIPKLDTFNEYTKSTLVFLPGLAEITKLHRLLIQRGCPEFITVIPLHSCLSTTDQTKVFELSRTGYRKVILATNIAESSITVRDVGFIIDFCLTKTLMKDPLTKFPTLKLCWSTKDRCIQRAGRTGRCCKGKVFRLINSTFFECFPAYAQPELLVAPLEISVLRIKNFNMGELQSLFALVLDPPPIQDIRTAVLELKQIGGLSSTYEGKFSDLDGDLTELGRVLSSLPIDVHLSKLIFIASILDVLDDAMIIAACLSTNRSVVRHMYQEIFETYINKLNWARGSSSDLFINLDVYKEYIYYKEQQQKDQRWMENFCRTRLLDEKKLHEVSALIEEIKSRLEQINIKTIVRPNMDRERNKAEDELMLKIAFCAAFYPNYFVSQDFDVQEVKRSLCGLDPTKTVILSNVPLNQCPLYCDQILNQLRDRISDKIDYIADNSRALLVINNDDKMPEKDRSVEAIDTNVVKKSPGIDRSVYLAIKYSYVDKVVVREYQDEAAFERMNFYKRQKDSIPLGDKLPPAWMKIVRGKRADNSRLINAPDSEFYKRDYYIEVDYNERQGQIDLEKLYLLELEEDAKREKLALSKRTKEEEEEDYVHPVFKKEYRRLIGPVSPIQVKFQSILVKSTGFNVDFDINSVNSIVLNPEYERNSSQMLVAASIGQARSNTIMARDTTLMPNIRGLTSLMALLFAQYYRLIFNEQTKCLAGAIFGLGWNENEESINRNYEVDLDFDVLITQDDIELINQCRRIMSELIQTIDLVKNPGAPRAMQQIELRKAILALLSRKRLSIPKASISHINYKDGLFFKDKHNVPEQQFEKLEDGKTRTFLPLIQSSKVYSEMEMIECMQENLDQLDKIRNYEEKPPIEGIRCLLCGSGAVTEHFFQMYNKIISHLESEEHLKKREEFELHIYRVKSRLSIFD